MVRIAHETIEILPCPKHAAAPQQQIGRFGGVRLPGMHDPIEPISRTDRKQRMDVIGHHAPSDQCIAIGIEPQKCGLNQFGNSWNCELSPAVTPIESGINGYDLVAAPRLPQLPLQPGRKAVRQPEDNMLHEIGAIAMRKIPA